MKNLPPVLLVVLLATAVLAMALPIGRILFLGWRLGRLLKKRGFGRPVPQGLRLRLWEELFRDVPEARGTVTEIVVLSGVAFIVWISVFVLVFLL